MAESEKTKSVGISTYARVRRLFTDRESAKRIVQTKTAAETGGKGFLTVNSSRGDHTKSLRTRFTDVFSEEENNEDCFERVCQPLINRCLEGYKVLLVAYGQTGSGKTFTLIGAKGPGQLGLLPRTIQALLEDERVLRLEMKGFEAYATSLTRIPLYDLFSEQNRFHFRPFVPPGGDPERNKRAEYKWSQDKSTTAKATWKSKKGSTSTNTMTQGEAYIINSVNDGLKAVELAHDASHFAKTGKNPESSRGHTVYVLKLQIANPEGEDYEPVTTEFVVVDLAGSEGGSTLEALPDSTDKTARFLEGGVINYGLTQLKDMFKEIRKKGKLKDSQGNGLRKLLYPFVTQNTMMSIVFTLSPSIDNVSQTRATMKFAQDACKLKMKPVKDKGKANYKKMYEKLKQQLEEKLDLVEELEKKIQEGIENSMEMRLEYEQLRGKMSTIYATNPDLNYNQFKKNEIDEYLDEMITSPIRSRMEAKIENYREMIKKIAEESDEEINVNEFVEDHLDRGVPLEKAYKDFCKKIEVDPSVPPIEELEESASPRTTVLNKRVSLSMSSQRSENWIAEAEEIQIKSRNLRAESVRFMEGVDKLIDLEVFSNDSGSETYSDSEGDVGKHNLFGIEDDEIEHEMPSESPPTQGEESGIPTWFSDLSKEEKMRIETFFGQNLENGLLTERAAETLMVDWDLSERQLEDLHRYLVFKRSQDVDMETIQDFKDEMSYKPSAFRLTSMDGDPSEVMFNNSDHMRIVVQLQNRIHQLENEKRVEQQLNEYTQSEAKKLIKGISKSKTLAESKASLFQSKAYLFEDELSKAEDELTNEKQRSALYAGELTNAKQRSMVAELQKDELRQELEFQLEIVQAKDEEIEKISKTAASLATQLRQSNFKNEKLRAEKKQLVLGRLEIMQQNNRYLEYLLDGGGSRRQRYY